jgi:diguanylate cyclase (GGDEF)-like protein
MRDPGEAATELPFATYYRREMRWATVVLFLFIAANYLGAPLYRSWLLGIPPQAPLMTWVLEYGVIVSLSVTVALLRWRWSDHPAAGYITLVAVAGVALAIIADRCVWVGIGVPFFNELIGYYLISVMVITGIEYRRLCFVAVPALVLDSAASYVLYGWGPTANFEMLSNFTAGYIAIFTGWFFEKNMRRVWAEANTLTRLAHQDTLTTLLNRRGFEQRAQDVLRQAVRERKPVAVAVLDLDHFKPYNDRYGHPAGDAALRAVARVLSAHARRPLDMVARLGGEEFVILWFDTSPDSFAQRCQALVTAIEALAIPHDRSGPSGRLTISLGAVSGTPQHAHLISQLIEQADHHLYQAKQQGRNQAVVGAL